ncbi:MAG: DUF2238 domain-containing protein [Kiritimatiellae bacterium]|nr:DUF2238 domain-containing protein [Kiritimatiellia bacterium]
MQTTPTGGRRPHAAMLASWGVLAAFTAVFLLHGNREFLLYAGTLALLIFVIQRSDRAWRYPAAVKWCFLAWLALHMCGGFVHLGGTRLYDAIIWPLAGAPYHILRYDQFVHAFCYFMIGGLLRTLTARLAAPGASKALLLTMTVLAALGVGALNEIVEFAAVACFSTDGVGDYFNNALDNVFNAVGALCALAWPLPQVHNGGGLGSPLMQDNDFFKSSPSKM